MSQSHNRLEEIIEERTETLIETNNKLRDEIILREQTEHTLRTQQAQLHQVQKMEALGTLAAGISHDFNNILSTILLGANLAMLKVKGDTAPTKNLEAIEFAGNKAKDLVLQILTFSHQSQSERIPVFLSQTVQDVLTLIRPTLLKNIVITFSSDGETEHPVWGNPTELHQVVLNLCTNAIQAMQETKGALNITIKARKNLPASPIGNLQLPTETYLGLTVHDSGHGIASEVRDRIFDPFFTTKGDDGGTGLGLSVTHGIVTNHGGSIAVDSQLGQGSTFTLLLPCAKDLPEETQYTQGPVPEGTGNILLVDDEAAFTQTQQSFLETLGYTVEAYINPEEALNAFKNDPSQFDLVLTNQNMPLLRGDLLAQQLLTIRPDLPIILCTGFGHLTNNEEAKALGIRAFLRKPILPRELAITLQEVLCGSPNSQA